MSTIGENIKAIRKMRGYTQKQLSVKCGIIETTIRKYELGITTPKTENLNKIATALDVPITSLTNDFQKSNSILGNAIKTIRESKELTVDDVANNLGINVEIIDSWEKGISEPDVVMFLQLCYYSFGMKEAIQIAKKLGIYESAIWDFATVKANSNQTDDFNFCPYCGAEIEKTE